MAIELGSRSDGVAFLVSAGVVFEIVAAMCSSPQTAEINAKKRSATLMKWVNLGLVTSALFVGAAVYVEKDGHRAAIIFGGGMAGIILWLAYDHAKRAGMKSSAPGTEDY